MPYTSEAQLAYLGFQLIPPGPLLRPFVRHYWTFRRDTPLLDYHEEYMHPVGGCGMVFNFGDTVRLDSEEVTAPVFLDGANTISRKMGFFGQVELIGVRFWTGGAYPFFAVPLAELMNEVAALDALDWRSLMRLYGRMVEAKMLPARLRLLEEWLLGRLALGKTRDPLIPASLAI